MPSGDYMNKAIVYGCGKCYSDTYIFLTKIFQIVGLVDKQYKDSSSLPKNRMFQNMDVICKSELISVCL